MYSRHEISRGHTNGPFSWGARNDPRIDESVQHGTAPVQVRTECRANFHRYVFPASGVQSPAWLLRLIILAGDIELNPGPPTWKCFRCFTVGRSNQSPLICSCGVTSHQQYQCSGVKRSQLNANWCCPRCTSQGTSSTAGTSVTRSAQPPAPTPAAQPSSHSPATSSTRCLKCNKTIPARIRKLACQRCHRPCHLQCSSLSRGAQRAFISTGTWHCDACVVIPLPTSTLLQQQPVMQNRRSGNRTQQSIRLLQWNCCGIRSKQSELDEILRSQKIDVACIQESKLRVGDATPSFPGYTSVRCDRRNTTVAGGGLVTIVKNDLPFQRQQSPSVGNLELLSIRLILGRSGFLHIVNAYRPPVRPSSTDPRTVESEWHALPSGPGFIIMGDVNAHDVMWDSNLSLIHI